MFVGLRAVVERLTPYAARLSGRMSLTRASWRVPLAHMKRAKRIVIPAVELGRLCRITRDCFRTWVRRGVLPFERDPETLQPVVGVRDLVCALVVTRVYRSKLPNRSRLIRQVAKAAKEAFALADKEGQEAYLVVRNDSLEPAAFTPPYALPRSTVLPLSEYEKTMAAAFERAAQAFEENKSEAYGYIGDALQKEIAA